MIMKLYCTRCGNELEKADLFCPYCGCKTELNIMKKETVDDFDTRNDEVDTGLMLCRNCGKKNSANECFCLNCGSRLNQGGIHIKEKVGKEWSDDERLPRPEVKGYASKQAICSECGEVNVSGQGFCLGCGAKLTSKKQSSLPDERESKISSNKKEPVIHIEKAFDEFQKEKTVSKTGETREKWQFYENNHDSEFKEDLSRKSDDEVRTTHLKEDTFFSDRTSSHDKKVKKPYIFQDGVKTTTNAKKENRKSGILRKILLLIVASIIFNLVSAVIGLFCGRYYF